MLLHFSCRPNPCPRVRVMTSWLKISCFFYHHHYWAKFMLSLSWKKSAILSASFVNHRLMMAFLRSNINGVSSRVSGSSNSLPFWELEIGWIYRCSSCINVLITKQTKLLRNTVLPGMPYVFSILVVCGWHSWRNSGPRISVAPEETITTQWLQTVVMSHHGSG